MTSISHGGAHRAAPKNWWSEKLPLLAWLIAILMVGGSGIEFLADLLGY